jgi:hypothetical protein
LLADLLPAAADDVLAVVCVTQPLLHTLNIAPIPASNHEADDVLAVVCVTQPYPNPTPYSKPDHYPAP